MGQTGPRQKDRTADKQSADDKLSNDFKAKLDKEAKDLKDTSSSGSLDLTAGGDVVIALLKRLLSEETEDEHSREQHQKIETESGHERS